MSAKEKALESMRARCKAIYQQIGRDAMLRQNDPVETLFRFALELTDDNSYVIGFNAGWEEREATWQAAGYRILAPGEMDAETVERCAAAITKANEKMPSIETPRMGGDNLAICLCSFFDDGDRSTEDDTGWSAPAREGYEEVTAAIKEHYATAIRSLGRRA